MLVAQAFCRVVCDELHILHFAVDSQFRSHGLGRSLLKDVFRLAKSLDVKKAFLEVRASNRSAIALYSKAGFFVTGRRKRYYADNGEDALVLCRSFERGKEALLSAESIAR